MILLAVSIAALFLLNLFLGSVTIPFNAIWNILWGIDGGESAVWQNIIWKSRVPQAITAMVAGLILGFYYLRYGSLVQVIMLHAMNNLTVCFMKSIGVAEMSIQELVDNNTIYWTIYAVSTTLFVVALIVMFKSLRNLKKSNSGDNM